MSLFRKEALAARRQKLHGDVFLTGPLSFKIITGLLMALVVLALIVVFTGSYSRTERVLGYLVPSGGLVKIQAGRFGTLKDLKVEEGDFVEAGDVLLSIEAAQLTLDGSSVELRSLQTVKDQRLNLENQILLEENKLVSETLRINSEIDAVRSELVSFANQIAIQKKITESSKTAYESVQNLLEKGYMSKAESERRRQAWLGQQAQGKLREQELETGHARLQQLDIRLGQLSGETQARTIRLSASLLDLDNREAELLGRHSYLVKAPVSGRIASITAGSPGQSVLPQQPILTILPEGSTLKAELFVPSRAVGFVKAGQDVNILYAAFPYQRFGSYPAKVEKITRTILSPNEVSAPFQVKEPVYRVTAGIESEMLTIAGAEIALQSGMQLEANIILEKRSFIDWLLAPLRAVGQG